MKVVTHAAGRPGSSDIHRAEWIHVQSPSDRTKVDYLRTDLDAGESEALVLAGELSADWILLDETKARLAAEFLKLNFIGTVGLLLLAKRKGMISPIRPLLDELRSKQVYISDKVYQAALNQAGE